MNRFFLLKFFFLCILFWQNTLFSQAYNPPIRMELTLLKDYQSIKMNVVGKNGLVVVADNEDKKSWTLSHYDTNFYNIISKKIDFNTTVALYKVFVTETLYCAVFHSQYTTSHNTFFLSYDIEHQKINVYAVNLPEKEYVVFLGQIGDFIVFSTVNNKREILYSLDCKTSSVSKLNFGTNEGSYTIEFLQRDTFNNCLQIGAICYEKGIVNIALTSVNDSGTIENIVKTNLDEKYLISSLQYVAVGDDYQIITGSFRLKGIMNNNQNIRNGLFTISIANNNIEKIHYLPYSNIENLNSSQRKSMLSNNTYSHTYSICQNDSLHILVTEFYNIKFSSTYPTLTSYDYAYPTYRYNFALISFINKEGYFSNFYMFNFNGLSSKEVLYLLAGQMTEEGLLIYFAFEDNLYSITYNKETNTQPVQIESILPLHRSDIVKFNYAADCLHWYDNKYIYIGKQKLLKRGASKKTGIRTVLYASKLIYD